MVFEAVRCSKSPAPAQTWTKLTVREQLKKEEVTTREAWSAAKFVKCRGCPAQVERAELPGLCYCCEVCKAKSEGKTT